MGARLLVLAVFVLAAAAAGDAFRGGGGEGRVNTSRTVTTRAASEERAPGAAFVLPRQGRFEGDGRFLHQRVLRSGREYLSAEAIEEAFPGEDQGPLDVSKIAMAPDGTLVLAVYRFPNGRPAAGAILFWRGREAVGAFSVPPGNFGGGLAFSPRGDLVALFSHDGALRGVYDREGRRFEKFPDRFLFTG